MSLAARQWNNLIQALHNGSCIVLLGPNISTTEDDGSPLDQQLAKELTKELVGEAISFDKAHENNLTYIMQRYTTIQNVAPSDPGFEAQNFYKKHKGKYNNVQKLLAELPFNLVINTSPDDAIVHAFKEVGKFETMFAWYDYRKEQKQEFGSPSKDTPLVFNLFGHYETAMSLVLTESDQVEFMKNVIKDQPPLPPKLIGQLDSHKTYLFLGFDWEQWNLRLLLEGMNLEKHANVLAHSGQDRPLQSKTKDFYESSFNFSFINQGMKDFVNELKKRFDDFVEEDTTQKNLFIVSESKDEEFRTELTKNLKPLPFSIMHEGLIEGGQEVDSEIKKGLESADIIILLVSADFLASETVSNREWPIILKRHQSGQSKVIPIITRSSNWQQLPELTQMPLILPKKGLEVGKPINTWENPDEAYNMITKEIQDLVKSN